MDDFEQSFAHNFYLTEEYARFCSDITNIPLKERTVAGQVIHTLKNKNVAISNYSEALCQEFKRQKITHLRVTPEFNDLALHPSLMEYSIFHKTTYEEAFKKYRTSFFHGLREGRKFPHRVRVVRRPDGFAVKVLPEFTYDRQALGGREARRQLTQEILRAFEPEIRKDLDQWYQFVPVWP
jgi:hypothetical protein